MSYLNEIISLNQLRSRSSSWRAWNIRRLAICESFIYLKFPPNLFFKSTFHLRTVYNKNVSVFNSLTYLVSYFLYKFISRKQRTPVTSHHFFTDLVSWKSISYYTLVYLGEMLCSYTLSMKWTPATTIGYKVWTKSNESIKVLDKTS